MGATRPGINCSSTRQHEARKPTRHSPTRQLFTEEPLDGASIYRLRRLLSRLEALHQFTKPLDTYGRYLRTYRRLKGYPLELAV